jgi:prepilin-type processing-associated H-X9-DG protein
MQTVTDEELIGYLCDALDPDDRAAVESHVRSHPDAALRMAELRVALAPLEADREPPAPRPDLAQRTLAVVAAHLAEREPSRAEPLGALAVARSLGAVPAGAEPPLAVPAPPRPLRPPPRDEPELTAVGGRFRLDLVVAGCIALFACGLVFSAIGKVRTQNQMLACQNTLRKLHTGLTGYADTHGGYYPQVGTGANPTADTFAHALAEQLPDFRPCCPVATPDPRRTVGYTYTLGYRAPDGGLYGVSRDDARERDLVPISADFPAAAASPTAGPTCPHGRVMNVLFVGGNVRTTTSALVGPNGDDIFRNLFGDVAAGKTPADIVLGRPGDKP